MRLIVFLLLACLPAFVQAQIACPTCQVRSILVEETVQTVEYQPVIVERKQMVEYVPASMVACTVAGPVFDVECGLKIAQDFLDCTATATTRRQRFRCAFTAALNNIDCILGTSQVSQRRVWFPRVKARRYARQMVRQ